MSATSDLEIMARVAQDLHEPLLGTEPSEVEYEEEGDSEEESSFSWCDIIMAWIILPTLLFIQFYLAFRADSYDTQSLSQPSVYSSILLFVITSCLFRHTCADQKIKSTVILVLPEIVMDVVLLLILVSKTEEAYLTLLLSMFLLSLYVCISCVKALCYNNRKEDELDQSFSRGCVRTCSIC